MSNAAILGRFAGPYTPAREADGAAYIAPMVDMRQARIHEARCKVREHLAAARVARLAGQTKRWCAAVNMAGFWRGQLARLLRTGGRL